MKQYYVMIGNFGSGKTELSLNFVMNAAKTGKSILVDLDIINPYFRSAERKDDLERAGVKLLYPLFALSTVDVPALPPDIYSVFVGDYETVVFDVGGDPAGATALGQYKANFSALPEGALQVFYVVNAHRPMSSTSEQVLDMIHRISYRSRLSITGLVNNSNLSYETKGEDLIAGYDLLKAVSEQTGIPVVYTSGTRTTLDEYMSLAKEKGLDDRYIGDPMELAIYMHRDWDRFTQYGI